MWNRKQKHTTPIISEQHLQAAYQLGYIEALKQPFIPTCPLHVSTPLWTETEPKPDGSWLYCVYCRQNQVVRETENMKTVHSVPGLHKTRLASPRDEYLTHNTSSQITALRPVVKENTHP